MNGAPFNLFISADEHFPIELSKKGKTIDEGVVYAIGKLAIILSNSNMVNSSFAADEESVATAFSSVAAPSGLLLLEHAVANNNAEEIKRY
jgi:molybdate transport system substrate-binding protein